MSEWKYSPYIWLDDIFVLQRLSLIWRVEEEQQSGNKVLERSVMTLSSSPGEKDLILLRQVSPALVSVEARDVSRVDDRVHQVAELLWKINW